MQQGDHNAFSLIYKRYWQWLIDFAYKRLQSRQDAEEIVQEVFIRLFERRAELDIHTSLNVYLHTAIRYKVFNKYREWMQQRRAYKILHLQNIDYSLPPLHLAEHKELEEQIQNAIQELPDQCRRVYLLRREEKLSNKAIAERLNISINTVERHMSKALRTLKEKVNRHYAAVTISLILSLYACRNIFNY